MKLKLTLAEMKALQVIIMYVLTWEAKTILQRILRTIIAELDKKISKKLEQSKKQYSFTISKQEALAFCSVFKNTEPNTALFEGNLILKLTNQIQQHYA